MNIFTKAVNMIKKFFYPNIENIYEIDSVLTATERSKINKWQNMYDGLAWQGDKYIKSLRLEKDICREFANICLNEMEYTITDEELQEVFENSIKRLNNGLQKGLGVGGFIVKPTSPTAVEYIPQGQYIPLGFDYNGRLIDCVFVEQKQDGKKYYTRLERHKLDDGLEITNRVFVSSSANSLGDEISIGLTDWDLQERVVYPLDRMDFGYFCTPIYTAENIGASIFDTSIDWILKADTQMARLDWEYESGERAIHVSNRALKRKGKMDNLNDRLYRGLEFEGKDGADLYKDFSPEFRDNSIISGLEEIKRVIEFNCGLSYGDLSNPEFVNKTATEIKASKERKYNTVSAIQEQLKYCLEDLVFALAFYNGKALSYEFTLNFKDSILTDEITERENDRQDVASGVMRLEEYRAKWYGEDLDTARANLPTLVDVE